MKIHPLKNMIRGVLSTIVEATMKFFPLIFLIASMPGYSQELRETTNLNWNEWVLSLEGRVNSLASLSDNWSSFGSMSGSYTGDPDAEDPKKLLEAQRAHAKHYAQVGCVYSTYLYRKGVEGKIEYWESNSYCKVEIPAGTVLEFAPGITYVYEHDQYTCWVDILVGCSEPMFDHNGAVNSLP